MIVSYLSDDETYGLPKVSKKALKRVGEKVKSFSWNATKIMERNAADVLNNIARENSGCYDKCLKRSREEV
jgi:hypothetical protein